MRTHVLIVSVVVAACNQPATVPGPEADIVLGEWEWSSSCCSIAGQAKNPATEGYVYVLQYGADGTVRAFRNNDLVATRRFTVTTSKPDPLADPITTITYDAELPHGPSIYPAKSQSVFKAENGTLSLHTQGCADCYSHWTFLPRLTSK